MRASYWLAEPEKTEATLTVTMKISEWRELMRQLPTGYPAWKFSSEIADMISKANRHFTTTPSESSDNG